MKHLKLYEELNNKPKLYDYVVCSPDEIDCNTYEKTVKLQNHVANNPGQIIEIYPKNAEPYKVKYTFGPDIFDANIPFSLEEILYFDKNKENCEAFIQALKYNL